MIALAHPSPALRCPEGCLVTVSEAMFDGYVATCSCYDGVEDAGPQLIGHGKTPEAALDAFVEREEEREEVWWWLTDLTLLVRAESKLSAGYRIIDGVYGPVPVA